MQTTAALGGTWLQNRWSLYREAEREKREDRLHRERLDREDRFRFANERRAAYAEFMAGCVQMFAQAEARSGTPEFLALSTATNRAYMHVVVMADPDTGAAAQRVWAVAGRVAAYTDQIDQRQPEFEQALAELERLVREETALQKKAGGET